MGWSGSAGWNNKAWEPIPTVFNFLGSVITGGATFSRASIGEYVNSAGVLASAATNVARFDYTVSSPAIRGVLVEPMVSNLLLNSTSLSSWGDNSMTNLSTSGTGPDGVTVANLMVPNTSSGYHDIEQRTSFGAVGTVIYWVIAKASGYRYFSFGVADSSNFTDEASSVLDTTTGIVTTKTTNNWTVNSQGAISLGNGWWLAWENVSTGTTAVGNVFVAPTPNSSGATGSYSGDGTSGGLYAGGGLEQALNTTQKPSSYIATTTAAVQRQADFLTLPVAYPQAVATITFDDASMQTMTVKVGSFTIPTNLAASRRVARVSITPATATPNCIFLETDMCGDIDDAAALAMLMAQAQAGNCQIIGVNANSSNAYSASCAAAILNHCGFGYVPVGAYMGTDLVSSSVYTSQVTSRFGPAGDSRANYATGVNNLRAALAAAPNASVTICSIGFFVNLAALLSSSADSISPMTGLQLINAKVKSLVIMGGYYTSGTEYNFSSDPSHAASVINGWPSTIPIYGVDFNLGNSIVYNCPTGDPLSNPFVYIYQLSSFTTRPSWDILAAMYAVGTFSADFNVQGSNGTNTVNSSSGANTWTSTAGNYSYLGAAISTSSFATIVSNAVNLVS